jgi:hypothetical protein
MMTTNESTTGAKLIAPAASVTLSYLLVIQNLVKSQPAKNCNKCKKCEKSEKYEKCDNFENLRNPPDPDRASIGLTPSRLCLLNLVLCL